MEEEKVQVSELEAAKELIRKENQERGRKASEKLEAVLKEYNVALEVKLELVDNVIRHAIIVKPL